MTVAEALDRVLEILRTTELYSPQLASKEDDPHTNDLVGGLMNVTSSIKIYMFILLMLYDYLHLWFSVTPRMACEDFLGTNMFSAKVSSIWTNTAVLYII